MHVLDHGQRIVHVLPEFLLLHDVEDLLALLVISSSLHLRLRWFHFEPGRGGPEGAKLVPDRKFLVKDFELLSEVDIVVAWAWRAFLVLVKGSRDSREGEWAELLLA